MIPVTDARALVHQHTRALPPALLPLGLAAGCTLAADVVAPYDMPLFPQAAMDGYAFAFSSMQKGRSMPVMNQVAAGDNADFSVPPGGAVRIFTGAAMPHGADTVVMQEKTRSEAGQVLVEDDTLTQGTNVRAAGSEIQKGCIALKAGSLLNAPAIGFLAMLGLNEVLVYPKPKLALLITGKELQAPGTLPERGKVYEANSFALIAALDLMGVKNVEVERVDDTLEATVAAVQRALASADLILLTGGISVGDYDFVLPAVLLCGVQQVFHKVKQRPGKPLFFGILGSKPVFGLPGNPSSVLSCFYQYVVPAIATMTCSNTGLQKRQMPLLANISKKPGLTQFLKAAVSSEGVLPLGAQESYRLSSFAQANCLIELPEDSGSLEAGAMVDVWLIGGASALC